MQPSLTIIELERERAAMQHVLQQLNEAHRSAVEEMQQLLQEVDRHLVVERAKLTDADPGDENDHAGLDNPTGQPVPGAQAGRRLSRHQQRKADRLQKIASQE